MITLKRKGILSVCALMLLWLMAFSVTAQKGKYRPLRTWSDTKIINNDWLYLERDVNQIPDEPDEVYQKISLPHTWNALDVLKTADYRRGGSWYRKHLRLTKRQLEKRLYLRFGAAGQEAKVFFNGHEMIYHNGGYSAFTCEITPHALVGDNVIDVWVCNKREKYTAPQTADYNFYGGLYRSVELIVAPLVSLSRNTLGGPGVRVWSEKVNPQNADLHISAVVDNGSGVDSNVTLLASVKNKKGQIVANSSSEVLIKANSSQKVVLPISQVTNPVLWSPESPELYSVTIALMQNKKELDQIMVNHGFRWYEFTADKGFFLNGKPYQLKGVNRHQDYYGEGNAIPLHRHLDDLLLMKEAGINWLRLAHYQQNDYLLQLCDQLGMLVWEEIPYVNNTPKGPEFVAALQSMMKDLINQHFNHPSIILWGMGNEVWMGDRGDGKSTSYDILTSLNQIIHSEDPVRQSVFVNGDNDRPIDLKVYEIPDVFGYNLYRGWYHPDYNSLTTRVNEIHSRMPHTPLIISEFGAGSDCRIHSENPVKQDFSIEYQNDFLESHLQQFEKMKWLCGVNKWALADFGAAHRGDSKPHVNQKGLVTFDRQKKDAYYLLKSYWSKDPVVYIESPFWTERSGDPEKIYRVFSNMDEVEFFHNGRSLGKQSSDFEWKVTLVEGVNRLSAKGKSGHVVKKHRFKVRYQKNSSDYRVSATSEIADHGAANSIDNNPDTYWSGAGKPELILDLNRICLVNGVTIQFYESSQFEYNTEILVSVDGEKWESQFRGKNNKRSHIESFMFDKQQEIRYVKIVGDGNSKNDLMSIAEIIPLVTLEKAEKNLYELIGEGADGQ